MIASVFCLALFSYFAFFSGYSKEVPAIAVNGVFPHGDSQEFALKKTSLGNDFSLAEQPKFSFEFQRKRNPILGLGALVKSFFADEYKNIDIQPVLVDANGREIKDVSLKAEYGKNGKFSVSIAKKVREFANGKYSLRLKIGGQDLAAGATLGFEQSFTWGVLAFNANRSVYHPDDEAYLQLAVLDDEGKALCDAEVVIDITAPGIGGNISLSTGDGTLIRNKECGPDNVIDEPDYYARQKLSRLGTYAIRIRATTKNGVREISDSIEVAENIPFEVERLGPTRINPEANYAMKIRIKANEDYEGIVKETVPKSFVILSSEYQTVKTNEDQELLIPLKAKAGETFEFTYTFDAPDVSPEFFLLGPLKASVGDKAIESRQWQIASDAMTALRAKTVQFLAGNYSGNGAAGQSSNVNYAFPSFDFRLAEKNVAIKSAYVIFETQYEAYITGVLAASADLSFDSCDAPCSPVAFTGTSTVSLGDSTYFSYNESNSSDQGRLVFDVSDEADLSGYRGNGAGMSAQVGYAINTATTQQSIASAQAVLVLTYTYDRTSADVTNTVIYPLDSVDSSGGTKATSTATNCAFGSTCPKYDYNMNLSEFNTASGSVRLSQWFSMQNQNDLNLTNDVNATVKIGTNATSSAFVLEAASSDEGNLPTHTFGNVAGFAENTAQTVQYRAGAGAGTFYLLGGETVETYTASSSAATKTRTASFPIGVITNISTALVSNYANVYFPENGMAATGTVKIKKAWFRIIGVNPTSAVNTLNVYTKVGSRATTTAKAYAYNPGARVAKPSFYIIHTIPAADYAELESANGTTSKRVVLQTQNTLAGQGGVSAELMITYSYSDESKGYLTSLSLSGGQTLVDPLMANRNVSVPTDNSVMPETVGSKTIVAGALLASYLNVDNDGAVGTTNTVDSSLSTGAPSCSTIFFANTIGQNSFSEYYKDIKSALNTTNNQSYTACYANSGGGDNNSGSAKMNGILIYDYKLDNNLPTSTISSASQESGLDSKVGMSVRFFDQDFDELQAKMLVATGTACNFSSPAPIMATMDENNVSASQGTVVMDNNQAYHIGSSTGTILTSGGENTVSFGWNYKSDIKVPAINTYCIGIMAYDGLGNQNPLATRTLTIDSEPPTITQVVIPDLTYKIGDTVRATVTVASDAATFNLASSSSINGATTTNIQKVNNTTYTVDYLVLDGDSDRASGTIPYAIALLDQYGNKSATSSGTFAGGFIDANSPKISSIIIPNRMFKIGDTVRATITVAADASVFSLWPSTINSRTVSNLAKVNNTTYTADYTIADGEGEKATSTIPYDISLFDRYGNKSASSSGFFTNGSLDGQMPVIQAVYITNGVYKIGDSIKVIVQADQIGYAQSAITINGKTGTGFLDNANNNYEIYYDIVEGDADRLSGQIPLSIVLADSYGNTNSPFTSPANNNASVDANKPAILKIYIPDRTFIIGDTIRATTTVKADDDPGYSLGTTTINGINATNLIRISSSTYTFDYTVVSGNTDRAAGTIPVSLMLKDGLGQYNNPASTTVETNTAAIDANKPVINSVSFVPTSGVLKIGSTATATIVLANSETGAKAGPNMQINGRDVIPTFTELGAGSYRVIYNTIEGDADRLDSEDLPVNFIVQDAAGNSSDVYFAADIANRPGTDAHRPVISSVTFNIQSGVLRVGDIATATIAADASGYASGTMTINGANVASTLKSAGGNNYTVTYLVQEGQTDVLDSDDLPVSFTLLDAAGNPSLAFNTPDITHRPGVDAHKPVISNVSFNITSGVLKVGDIATATIFSDAAGYASGTMTINGVNVASTLKPAGGSNYTVTYLVQEGQTDVLDSDDLPVSLALVDAANNVSIAYNTPDAGNRPGVDAHKPVIANVVFSPTSGLLKVGDTATATISVSSAEAGLSVVTATINSVNAAGTFTDLGAGNYRVAYTVVEGQNDINDISDLPVAFRLSDAAGNQSDIYSVADAANRPGVDGHKPVISSVSFNITSGVLKIGDIATATIYSDGTAYASGTMTINGVDVAGTLASAGGNNYTVTYAVIEGQADILDSADLPISLALKDAAGNLSSVYNTVDINNRPGVDAHKPVIANVTFNITSGLLKIGQIATATLISDGTGYIAGTMTINGVNVAGTLKSAGGNNYTVTYLVQEGQTDLADTVDLPVNFTLIDAAGNNSLAFNTADFNNRPGVDAHVPTVPGNLTFNRHTNNTIVLNFGATSTEANFREYKIFYKVGSAGVTEADSVLSSSTDANLGNILFNNKATTTINNLATNTQYAINIWVYDQAGNKANAVEITNFTNRYPVLPSALFQKRYTGTNVLNGSWLNEPTVTLEATSSDADADPFSFYYQFVTNATGFIAATTTPGASCNSGTAYNNCASKVWKAGTRSDWYNPAWPYRKQIIIDGGQIASSETRFPFLASTSSADLKYLSFGGHVASSTGGEMVITDSDGITALPYEREFYSSSTGQFIAWVSTSTTAYTHKTLYLYYGNGVITTDQASTTGPWDSASKLILHLNTFNDSSASRNNATNNATTNLVGQIYNAKNFSGAAQWISTPVAGFPANNAAQTLSVWAKYAVVPAAAQDLIVLNNALNSAVRMGFRNGVPTVSNWAGTTLVAATANPPVNVWHNYAYVYTGANNLLYIDGQLASSTATAVNVGAVTTCNIGRWTTGIEYWTGQIDEVRVQTGARSAGWIKASYLNQKDLFGLASYSTEEASSALPYKIILPSIPDASAGYKWQVLACDSLGACSNWTPFNSITPNLLIDSLAPTMPGNLTLQAREAVDIILRYGATTTEANFSQYKIYYKQAASDVTESDSLFGSSSDANLGNILYNNKATTTVINLTSNKTYTFNIYAYDLAGNKSRAFEYSTTTIPFPVAPTGVFNSIAEKTDGLGSVDISITVADFNNDDLRARLDYVVGTSCNFAVPLDPTLDANPANVSATNGTVLIDNASAYQVGTSTDWIDTNSGPNTVNFDWLSKANIPGANGVYCLRLTANDGGLSQTTSATSTVLLDNVKPTNPGNLTLRTKSTYSFVLNYGATTTETNIANPAYRIYYKQGTSGVAETDTVQADSNLNNILFNASTTTTITGLSAGTPYVFNIWAYDIFGNKATATEASFTTNYIPATPASLGQWRNDGTTAINNQAWTNENNFKLKASVNDGDSIETLTLYFEVASSSSSFTNDASSACASTTAWSACPGRVWKTVSASGDYSVTPFTGIVNPANVPDSAEGLKWQAKACDLDGVCSAWTAFNASTPNLKVNAIAPTIPGSLTLSSVRSGSATLTFGAPTQSLTFYEYKIFYKIGTSGVNESDSLFGSTSEAALSSMSFGGKSTTTISNLTDGSNYVFNIWAYDIFGRKAVATVEAATTTNYAPTAVFTKVQNRKDGSGIVDISFTANDLNQANLKAKLEYATGTACNFANPSRPTLDETDANATSTHGDAKISNGNQYQIGNSAGWIVTTSGSNTVNFPWLSRTDLPQGDAAYCLRLTASDGIDDQLVLATATVMIDNVAPTTPGDLQLDSRTSTSLVLRYGATTTETNFLAYKIFYGVGAVDVSENDLQHNDPNLYNILFNGKATTTRDVLLANHQYSFRIYAYDSFGNKGNSGVVTYTTNAPPTGVFNSAAEKTDASGIVDISIEVYDINGDGTKAKLEFATGTSCNFSNPGKPTLDTNPANISADYDIPDISNANPFQIGSVSSIKTASGSNTVNFDWNTAIDIPNATSTYCLRLTANDGKDNQEVLATTTLIVDNVLPVAPGSLSVMQAFPNRVRLAYGSAGSDSNFKEYKIFYKKGSGGVTESDSAWSKYNSNSLGYVDYYATSSTLLTGLDQVSLYYFNIWIYDNYGHKAQAGGEVSTTTLLMPSATWREDEDISDPTTGTYLGKQENFRLRIAIANIGDYGSGGNFQLEYAPKGSGCASAPAWTAVSIAPGSEHFAMSDNVYFEPGASSTQKFANPESYVFTPGYVVKAPVNKTGSQTIDAGGYTELEYAINATTQSARGGSYCFRLTDNGQAVDNYGLYPELTLAPPPQGIFVGAVEKSDGSGKVDFSIQVGNPHGDFTRAKLEYATGTACNFSQVTKPLLDATPENIQATYGTVAIDNASAYQIGTTSGMIETRYGTNTIDFDWDARAQLGLIDNTYCFRLTANDTFDDQPISATTTVIVDQIPPTVPGNLTQVSLTSNSATLGLSATSSDTNFREYRIYYKLGQSGVTESDTLWGSSSDANLGLANLNGATSTIVTGLTTNKYYYFKLFAYDKFGNKAQSSGELEVIIRYRAKSENWRFYYDAFNETPTSTMAFENAAPSNVSDGSTIKLRLGLKETENVTGVDIKTRLQYSTYSDFSADVNFVGEIGSSTLWTYGDGIDADGSPVSKALLNGISSGAIHNESGISTSTYIHAGGTAVEWEYTIRNNGAVVGTTYYFRAFDNQNGDAILLENGFSYPSIVTGAQMLGAVLVGFNAGSSTEGVTANIVSTPSTMNFGTLTDGSEKVGIHRFTVNTNAGGGYQLYLYEKQTLISNNGAYINPVSGTNDNPQNWPVSYSPSAFGYHSGDDTLSGALPSRFASDNTYARFESGMKEVGFSPIPASNDVVDVVYRIGSTRLQAAGDYETEIVYILVPTFY